MKVSVIIPCYNYGRYLPDAVESVVNQTFQDFEIIIVNDGSTDDTVQVAEFLIKKYPQQKISLVNQNHSGQPAVARNNGIKISKGEYILCLDADDKIAATMLEECVSLLEKNPAIAIVYTDRLDFDGADQIVQADEYDFSKLKYQNQISYCALYKREVWDRVGGYRTNVRGCEDWDFWVAAGAKGFIAKRIPKALFYYRRHDVGVFYNVQWRLHEMHAQIVLNNSDVFSVEEINSAKEILSKIESWKLGTTPTVSVIVPTYNRQDQLFKAIQSIQSQTFQDYEIIVINDGGEDVSNIINELNNDRSIIYVNLTTNKGLPAARNTGIKIARGKYIAYLDDDDIYYPDHLKTLVDFLENSNSKIAYTDAIKAIYKKIDGCNVIQTKQHFVSGDFDYDRIFVENYIPVLCFMHTKSCFDDVEMFDESLTSHEDWDLWIRMSMKFAISHIPKITCEFSWIDDDVRESKRRIEFLSTLQTIYTKYKAVVLRMPNILEAQNEKLAAALSWAYRHISELEKKNQFIQEELNLYIKQLQEKVKHANSTIQTVNARLAAIQENLSWRILNKYVFKLWDNWLIPFGSKRRAVLEKFFRGRVKSSVITPAQNIMVDEKPTNRIIKSANKKLSIKKFLLYTNSNGNYFFNEIRDLIASGINELGYETEIRNENKWLCDDDAWHVVVAPHEFFYLGNIKKSENEILPENLILVNTEQPSTQWFSLAESYFPNARFIWDINYDSTKRISQKGIACNFLPLGFSKNCYLFQEVKQLPENYGTCFLSKDIKTNSYLNDSFKNRPIDISFIGCATPRREEFFAQSAAVTSKYYSYIHFSDGLSAPVVPGITTHMNTETVIGLMQRSKITLNIHHGVDNYFEWHRIVILGIGQRNLVISEPSISSPIFQPGVHYIEAKLKDIPEKIMYYLSNPKGMEEAQEIIESGYKKLTSNCLISDTLKPLISQLGIK